MAVVEVEWIGKVELVGVEPSQGDWVHTAGHLQWVVGDLPPFAEARIAVVVRPLRAGEVNCEVGATTLTFDPITENDTDSVSIEVLPQAELLLTQSGNRSPVMVGDQLTYTISVRNHGDYTVSDVRVVDQLPMGVELVSAIISQGIVTNLAGMIEWSLGPLVPGEGATVLATVVPQQAGPLTNQVSLLSAYVDPENPALFSELVIESVAEPPLNIVADGSRVVLAWPAIADDYILEVSDGLTPPAVWMMDGNPHVVEGNQITVTVKVTNGRRFYRLVRPS